MSNAPENTCSRFASAQDALKDGGWLDQSLRIIATETSVTLPLASSAASRVYAPSAEALLSADPQSLAATARPAVSEGLAAVLRSRGWDEAAPAPQPAQEGGSAGGAPQLLYAVFQAAPAKRSQAKGAQGGAASSSGQGGSSSSRSKPAPAASAASAPASATAAATVAADAATAAAASAAKKASRAAAAAEASGRTDGEPPGPYSQGAEGRAQRWAVEHTLSFFRAGGGPPKPQEIPRIHCPDRAAFEACKSSHTLNPFRTTAALAALLTHSHARFSA